MRSSPAPSAESHPLSTFARKLSLSLFLLVSEYTGDTSYLDPDHTTSIRCIENLIQALLDGGVTIKESLVMKTEDYPTLLERIIGDELDMLDFILRAQTSPSSTVDRTWRQTA